MKIIGIVAEYNPYHNGHHYQITKTKETLKADGVVAIMSGNFVQRGMPAFVDKWKRAEMAISCGANLILELPTYYATSSAEDFAMGAIELLNATGVINHLSFGSETTSLTHLKKIAQLLVDEPVAFKHTLTEGLNLGLSYPKARDIAIQKNLDALPEGFNLNQSNAILGIEYLKALRKLDSLITPQVVKRIGKGYHDTSTESKYASATAIRKAYFDDPLSIDFTKFMPLEAVQCLIHSNTHPVSIYDFEKQLFHILRRSTAQELSVYREVNEGLEFKIVKEATLTTSYDALVSALKSKRYAQSKINRMLLNILLGIKKEPHHLSEIGYLRILGMDAIGQEIAKQMKKNARLPIITNINKAPKEFKSNPLLLLDQRATDMYCLAQKDAQNQLGGKDHLQTIIRSN